MRDEGAVYEGLRLGSARAFAEVVTEDGPAMRRIAALYVDEPEADAVVRHAWTVALHGLDMFTWHTSLRAWLTGILVANGRARAGREPLADRPEGPPGHPGGVQGPLPWATLPWSAHWHADCWEVVERAVATQPLAVREVLWLSDVEGLEWREVLDTLGLTHADGRRLLLTGRDAVAAAVARHLGVASDDGPLEERRAGAAGLLGWLRSDVAGPAGPDPALGRAFAAWRRRRAVPRWRRWRWEHARARRHDTRVTAAGR